MEGEKVTGDTMLGAQVQCQVFGSESVKKKKKKKRPFNLLQRSIIYKALYVVNSLIGKETERAIS